MKITLIMVQSLNGKTTKGQDPIVEHWTSLEDQTHFKKLRDSAEVIIMGAKTYEVIKDAIDTSGNKLRVILTKNPQQYNNKTIPGKLEFTSDSPLKLLMRLKELKRTRALLVGGATINALFLQEHLVDEIYITIEPKIFGQGNHFVGNTAINISLKLLSSQQLNPQGTLLLHYQILPRHSHENGNLYKETPGFPPTRE